MKDTKYIYLYYIAPIDEYGSIFMYTNTVITYQKTCVKEFHKHCIFFYVTKYQFVHITLIF